MKQMISNHREIESLENFLYYDKATGKVKIKKQLDLTFSTGAISQVIGLNSSGNLVKGSVSSALYNHIVNVSRTGDYEDDPFIIIEFVSTKATYTKAEFEAFIKNVATIPSLGAPYLGLQCLGYNAGYAAAKEGNYFLYWDGTNFGAKKLSGNTINLGTSFNTFSIVSKQI